MKKSALKNHGNGSESKKHEGRSGQNEGVKKATYKKLYKKWSVPGLTIVAVLVLGIFAFIRKPAPVEVSQLENTDEPETIILASDTPLPQPDFRSSNSIEAVLRSRQSKRDFFDRELTLKQVSQILWSAQGITVDWGGRTAPSSKDTFPISVYLITSKVNGLDNGEYQYIAGDRTPVHQLRPIKKVDLREAIFEATNLSSLKNPPAVLVVTGNMSKMADAYGGIPHDKEVFLEAGSVAQNIALQAESLKLGTVIITIFEESRIRDLVTIPDSETIIYLMPIGIPTP